MMILVHFMNKQQVAALKRFVSEECLQLMLEFAMTARDLQALREGQEQKRLDRIAASVFPPALDNKNPGE